MIPGSSKLNPYAAAYVPLAKQGEDPANLARVRSDGPFAGSSSHDNTLSLHADKGHSFYGSSSQEYGQDAENQADDGQQLEMDVAYLQTQFPTISEQSLVDVYCVNEYDLDAAYDMLSQFESLPNSLDIGDVSEPQILPELANLKLKEVAAATGSVSADSPYICPAPASRFNMICKLQISPNQIQFIQSPRC